MGKMTSCYWVLLWFNFWLFWSLGWSASIESFSGGVYGSGTDRSFSAVLTGVSDPTQYTIISATQAGLWWGPKSYLVPNADGSFIGSVGSATNDKYGSRIAIWVFLTNNAPDYGDISILNVPKVNASTITGQTTDVEYFGIFDRYVFNLNGGQKFGLRALDGRTGPGNNYFGWNSQLSYQLENDHLQLYIYYNETDKEWYCTEYYAVNPLGYGSYIFATESRVDLLSHQSRWSVLGLFTYDSTSPESTYSELDFEVAKWGYSADPTNAQFVIQPYQTAGNLKRYTIPNLTDTDYNITYAFYWSPTYIYFACYRGLFNGEYFKDENGQSYLTLIADYNYTDIENIPPPYNTVARLNLWLANNTDVADLSQITVDMAGFWHFSTPFFQLEKTTVSTTSVSTTTTSISTTTTSSSSSSSSGHTLLYSPSIIFWFCLGCFYCYFH